MNKVSWFIILALLASVCISQAKASDQCKFAGEWAYYVMVHRQTSGLERNEIDCSEGSSDVQRACNGLFDAAFMSPKVSEPYVIAQEFSIAIYMSCMNQIGHKA